MKKLLLLLLIILTAGKVCAASPINVDYNDGIYHIVISGEKIKKKIQFISSSSLITNREAHFKNNSLLTINTGFFDPQNQKTISYIINDCIAEVWGFKKARLIIWSGFAMNFFVVALGLIAVAIPAAPFWEGEEHFNFVFGMAPRIVAASLMAFLVGSFLNAYVMSKMKVASQGRNFSARAIWSTVVGETADSLIFFPVAFGGVIAWKELLIMMGIQIVLKSMYEVIILPVTIRVVKAIKKIDGSDVYDTDISYNVLKVKDI